MMGAPQFDGEAQTKNGITGSESQLKDGLCAETERLKKQHMAAGFSEKMAWDWAVTEMENRKARDFVEAARRAFLGSK